MGTKDVSTLVESFADITSLGGGLKLTAQDKVELTNEYAAKHLGLSEFCGERGVRPSHLAALVTHMKRGTFRSEWVQLMVCKCKEACRDIAGEKQPAGTLWRMNGKHTSNARLQLPAGFRCPVQILRYTAETAYDMRMLYASIDRNGPRTSKHIMKSYLAGSDAFENYSVAAVTSAPAGLAHWQWGDSSYRNSRGHDADELAYLIQTEYYNLSKPILSFLTQHGERSQKFLLRVGVVGAMYATFNKSISDSEKFWDAVATGLGFSSKGDARLKLRNALLTSSIDGRTTTQKNVCREVTYRWCIASWNAFREGRAVQVLRVPEKRPAAK